MIKRLLFLILVSALILGTTGCMAEEKDKDRGQQNAQTRLFTDSTGRTVEIPENIGKIAVTGMMSQIVVYAFSPELMVGWSSTWGRDVEEYVPEKYLKLPVLGQLYGGKSELNLEELIASGAEVVVDIGETKPSVAADMDSLTEQTGIPFIHIDYTTGTTEETFRMLGELTGLTERAEEYIAYWKDISGKIRKIAEKPESEKKRILYCMGDMGCNVIAKGSYHAEIIDMLTENAAVLDDPSSKGTGNAVDMEQILLWNPEFIIFAPDSVYDEVEEDKVWKRLDAVSEGKYAEVPFALYNWMGFPPSVQRIPGMLWLADLLYPEECDFDLKTEIKRYYSMFCHCELTDGQYDKMTKRAFFK